jgi:hypothetical protein
MRQTSCQYGGILPIDAGSILLILLYGLLLALNLFAMLQLLPKLTTWISICPPYSTGQKGGRPREEKRIKGALEIAIDKTEKKKKKTAETWKKHEPIEPDDPVEYRTIKKKRKKETVAKAAKGKGKVAKGKGGERKRGYKKRVTLLGLYNILDRYSRYLRTSTYVRK